jgi:hypothetical protein
MSREAVAWRVIHNDESANISDDEILSCFLGTAFYVSEYRNAWHSTPTVGGWTHPTRETAHACVSENSKRGSGITLTELPAIAVVGNAAGVIIFERQLADLFEPFKTLGKLTLQKKTLFGFMERVYSDVAIIGPACEVVPARLPFRRWFRKNEGGENVWMSAALQVELTYACDAVTQIALCLQRS